MSDLSYHEAYAVAAATTLAVEAAVVFIVARRERLLHSAWRIAGAVVVANALTHPALWYVPYFAFPGVLTPGNHALYVGVGEAAAFVVEAAAYWALLARGRPWLAVALSALANAASYGAGLIVGRLTGA